MKEYSFEVKVTWTQAGIEAENEAEAREKLRETFNEEFGFYPDDEEITLYDEEITLFPLSAIEEIIIQGGSDE